MVQNATVSITQDQPLGRQCTYTIVDGAELHAQVSTRRRTRSYRFNLFALDPEGTREWLVDWRWLKIAGSTTSVAVLFALVAMLLPESVATIYLWSATMLFASLTVLGLVMFLLGTRRVQRFVSEFARVPMVDLQVGRPDKENYAGFVEALQEAIVAARANSGLSRENHLAGELRMLRRLQNEGVVPEATYEESKSALLALAGSRA
ncbi:MAG: hypothetical protein JSW10_00665 [Pseudomonadota bacterium]|nr:MAG: hypothetical protein JSW10_00665 [Pseudomonadota bacterium]